MRRSIDFTKKGEKTSSINPDTLHPNTRSERRQATCGSIGMYCSFDILPQFHECELPSMISNMAHGVRSTSRKCNYRDKHIWIWRSSIRKPFELIKYESFEFTSPISKWLIFDQKLGRRTAATSFKLKLLFHLNIWIFYAAISNGIATIPNISIAAIVSMDFLLTFSMPFLPHASQSHV